jgi:hypothetical protein
MLPGLLLKIIQLFLGGIGRKMEKLCAENHWG